MTDEGQQRAAPERRFITNSPASRALRRADGPDAALMRAAADEIDALRDALLWCGGSPSFGPGGEAEEGWRKVARPLLGAGN